jgi:hypothetical protein
VRKFPSLQKYIMDNSTNLNNKDITIEKADLVWDIYKYRHDLCWRLLFQTVIAVVFVSVAPYINEDVTLALGWWILVSPGVGVVLTVLSVVRLLTELDLWKEIKDGHHELQKALDLPESRDKMWWLSFKVDLIIYLSVLLLLSIANVIAVAMCWIPYLEARK